MNVALPILTPRQFDLLYKEIYVNNDIDRLKSVLDDIKRNRPSGRSEQARLHSIAITKCEEALLFLQASVNPELLKTEGDPPF